MSSLDRAAFAVSSRLFACLVTESLLRAVFFPAHADRPSTVGVCLFLSKHATNSDMPQRLYQRDDIFAIIALRSLPVFKSGDRAFLPNEIALLDPLDMLPYIYSVHDDGQTPPKYSTITLSHVPLVDRDNTPFCLSLDPLFWWKKISSSFALDHTLEESIAEELQSSFFWQKHAYENWPPCPTFTSPSIEWERAITEGHPTHPMHRTRHAISPMPPVLPGQYDFHFPRIRFASFPRDNLTVYGAFESLLSPVRAAAARNARRPLSVSADRFVLPVHELQVPNIAAHFPDADILPPEFSVPAAAQASLRTVALPPSSCAPPHHFLMLKLALGLVVSSVPRTISHYTAHAAPRLCELLVSTLRGSGACSALHLEPEVASVVHRHHDPTVARHCAALIRTPLPSASDGSGNGDTVVIPAAALVEPAYPDGPPLVVSVFGLHTPTKRRAFLAAYITALVAAFLPPLLEHGIALEAHAQNTLARFDPATRALCGFALRDLGGVRIIPSGPGRAADLAALTLPGHSAIAATADDAYAALYHALMHSHLARLIRVLDAHHDGSGWALLRSSLAARIPQGTDLWRAWLDPAQSGMVRGKCLLRMKMAGPSRGTVYGDVPNLILFRVQEPVMGKSN